MLSGIEQRPYADRDEYVQHQTSKTQKIMQSKESILGLLRHDHRYRITLYQSLDYDCVRPGARVLCLGARAGGEVRAFIDKGCFAVGIDLYPLPGSKYVVRGDFNHIQYPDRTLDIVFTNSLDHTNDLSATIAEVHRVLRDGGHLIVEIMSDTDEWSDPWRSCNWSSVEDVIGAFVDGGFEVVSRKELPAQNVFGMQLCFVKK